MSQPPDSPGEYVFLSYASADRERALRIAELLEANGIVVWVDRKSIAGGTSWSAEIVQGIEECTALVVLCSVAAMASPNVQQELQLAWEHRRPILPLRLDLTLPPRAIEYVLAGRQWIDVLDQADDVWFSQALRALAGLGIVASSRSAASPQSPATASLPANVPPAHHNLPAQLTSFVGRERELAEVKLRLQDGQPATRLLTLTGTGGCGKTRLALEVGNALQAAYPDGVWLVELAPLADPALVAPTAANNLGVHEEAGRPVLVTLVAAVRTRRLLLILDNCEHLIDSCAKLADTLLRSCPLLQVLATSREALGIVGEVSWRVPSLAVPESDAMPSHPELLQNEAVGLFVARAQAVLPGFSLTSQNAPAVVHLCQRLDGIPLALELAAGRLKGLSAEQLAARLDQRFRLLTGGSRAALPRQQTLAAMVSWSYDLLSEAERALFHRLGVFVGGFTLEAAEAVGGDETAGNHGAGSALELLLRLVEMSLVLAEPGEDGADRYRLLETLRQYAGEKLAASGEAETVHRRHQAYYFALAEEAGREFWGPRLAIWYPRMQRELNNMRAALRWASDAGEVDHALQVCSALGVFLYYRGQPSESRRWLAELLAKSAASEPTAARGRTLMSLGTLAWNQLDLDQADALLDEALAILRRRNDQEGIAAALGTKGAVAIERGGYEDARALLEEALAIERTLPVSTNTTFHILGQAYFYLADYPLARASVEQDIARRGALEDTTQAANFNWLGNIATATGDYQEARALYAERMRRRLRIDRKLGVAFTLSGLAGLAAAQGQLARAVRIAAAAAQLCELSGVPAHRTQEGYIRGKLPGIRETLGATGYAAVWAEGQSMTLEQVVDFALSDDDSER